VIYLHGLKKHPATFGKMPSSMPISLLPPVLMQGLEVVVTVLKRLSSMMPISLY
jgi:putative transposase